MKIDLPLETWTDLFGFLPRSQLVQIVSHIEDRQFAKFVQFFLHECGQITLEALQIKSSSDENGLAIIKANNREVPLATVPMPENITNFTKITISSFTPSVFFFLKEFHQNSLFTNVNVVLHFLHEDIFSEVMANIVPMIDSVESITLDGTYMLNLFQNENPEITRILLISTRVLYAHYNFRDDWFCDWLSTPREDGKARVLYLTPHVQRRDHAISCFVELVKKDFLEANRAVNFIIRVYRLRHADRFNCCKLENLHTNERMVIKRAAHTRSGLIISRFQMEANEECFDRMGKFSSGSKLTETSTATMVDLLRPNHKLPPELTSELPYLLMPQFANWTQIHLGIRMGMQCSGRIYS